MATVAMDNEGHRTNVKQASTTTASQTKSLHVHILTRRYITDAPDVLMQTHAMPFYPKGTIHEQGHYFYDARFYRYDRKR